MVRSAALPVALLLGSCTMAPAPTVAPTPAEQAQLAAMLAGKVAGPPQRCLAESLSTDMHAAGPTTLTFRAGSTVYVNHVEGNCYGAERPGYTLVFKPFGFGGNCENDVVHVVDASSGMFAGSCTLGPFIPYSRPR